MKRAHHCSLKTKIKIGDIEKDPWQQIMPGFCNLFYFRGLPSYASQNCSIIWGPRRALFWFFPEAKEAEFAKQTIFGGVPFRLDYLTKPSLLEDFGFGKKLKISNRIQPTDEIFLVAYPYFNLNEMLVVEELYKDAVVNSERKMIIFNGELDRMRGGYYPSFFFPKIANLSKAFLPKIETLYYIHNFKGRQGGTLFRSYPGPWKVLRKVNGTHICLHQQETMPSLKDVAVNILPYN